RNGSDVYDVRASTLVAAAGGFEANIKWLREYWGPRAENFLVRGTPYNTGTLLRMLLDHGVMAVGDPTQCHAVAIDARAPKFDGGIVTRHDCIVFSVVVNRNAERFYDEGEDFWPKRYAIWGRLLADQPGQIAYSIFDSKADGQFMPPVYPAIEAATLEELAGKLELDGDALSRTIADFNAAATATAFRPDILDGKGTVGIPIPKSNWAVPIDAPPYRAFPLRPGITFTYLGTRVNRNARMVMQDGKPSANMFAAGEIMAGNILGKGYLAGFGMTIGGVFGRIAGEEAAAHARN
ncbi:MAG: FAD-dependent tricarballylate dehydrogenase TcuA, partial [Hyphomicrobiales bacterium]